MKNLVEILTSIAKRWQDSHYFLRQKAIELAAPEFCLSKTSFERGLNWIFEQWTKDRIQQNIAQNPFKKNQYAIQVLAGTTPAMIAQGFFQGVILNMPQCLKIPKNQSTFAQLLHQSFIEYSAEFSILLKLTTDLSQLYMRLKKADLLIAYGQDETMEILRSSLKPGTTFMTHGHAESAAILLKEAANIDYLEKLADDMLCYDQRGCLSPRVVFIEEDGELNPAECAKILAENILPKAIKKWPSGGFFSGELAEILHQRIVYGFRGQVYTGTDWTVCYDEKLIWPKESLPRFLPFKSFKTTDELVSLLAPIKNRLISLGLAGSQEKIAYLNHKMNIPFCEIGKMQKQLLVF